MSLNDLVNASRDYLPFVWLGLLVASTLGVMLVGTLPNLPQRAATVAACLTGVVVAAVLLLRQAGILKIGA